MRMRIRVQRLLTKPISAVWGAAAAPFAARQTVPQHRNLATTATTTAAATTTTVMDVVTTTAAAATKGVTMPVTIATA